MSKHRQNHKTQNTKHKTQTFFFCLKTLYEDLLDMLCQGTLQESNQTKKCWLPASQTSQFHLCRRCHFHKVTDSLDSLGKEYSEKNQLLLRDQSFVEELLHPAREQALLNLLSTVYTNNKEQFLELVTRFEQIRAFPIFLQKRIETHHPGTRCSMYRVFLKQIKIKNYKAIICWSCIAWSLKQRDTSLLTSYLYNFAHIVSHFTEETVLHIGSKVVVDLFASLYLLGYHHHIRILIDQMLRTFHFDVLQGLLLLIFQEPPFLSVFFEGKVNDFLPLPLRDTVRAGDWNGKIKKSIKKKTNLFKEELVQVTWHPDRMFHWCLDLEEKSEFA